MAGFSGLLDTLRGKYAYDVCGNGALLWMVCALAKSFVHERVGETSSQGHLPVLLSAPWLQKTAWDVKRCGMGMARKNYDIILGANASAVPKRKYAS